MLPSLFYFNGQVIRYYNTFQDIHHIFCILSSFDHLLPYSKILFLIYYNQKINTQLTRAPYNNKPMLNPQAQQDSTPWKIDDQTLAMILIVIGSCSFSCGYIYCNQNKFHPVETSCMRGISVTIICFALVRYMKFDLCFKSSHNLKWLLARNAIMVLHNFGYTVAQFYLPLPIAITINSISPIFVYIYDYYLYGVTINKLQMIFLIISIIGVAITANSSYLITYFDQDFDFNRSTFQYQSKDPLVMTYSAVALTIVMMMHAYGIMLTKKLINVHTVHVNFIQGILILFSSAIFYPMAEGAHNYARMDMQHFLKALVYSGIPISIGQLSYIGALILTKNMGVITTLSFSSIVVGNLISIVRYGEEINMMGVIGSMGIVVGIIFIVKQRDREVKR